MPRPMKFSVLYFVLLWTAASTLAQTPPAGVGAAEGSAVEEAASAAADGAAKQPGAKHPEARRQALVSKMWWNQPQKIEELELSPEQRRQMDALLVAFLADRERGPKAQQDALSAFSDALLGGDRPAAGRQADEVAEAMSDPVRRQLDMMIEVAALMTAKQRQELIRRYPRMFSRLWIRSANPRSGMAGRVRAAGQP